MNKTILKFQNVNFGFTEILIQNFNVEVQTNKFIALMGVNGTGKSCFIKTLCGINPILKGSIFIDGIDIQLLSQIKLAQNIAVVLTEKNFNDSFLVSEIVGAGRAPFTNWFNYLSSKDEKIINESMELLKILELKNDYFSRLSDGQKQKVLLAKALAQTPKVLILDEPTNFLDIPSKLSLFKNIKKICVDKNLSVIMSTHELSLLKDFVDEVWIIDKDSKTIETGPIQMIDSDQFKEILGLNLSEI